MFGLNENNRLAAEALAGLNMPPPVYAENPNGKEIEDNAPDLSLPGAQPAAAANTRINPFQIQDAGQSTHPPRSQRSYVTHLESDISSFTRLNACHIAIKALWVVSVLAAAFMTGWLQTSQPAPSDQQKLPPLQRPHGNGQQPEKQLGQRFAVVKEVLLGAAASLDPLPRSDGTESRTGGGGQSQEVLKEFIKYLFIIALTAIIAALFVSVLRILFVNKMDSEDKRGIGRTQILIDPLNPQYFDPPSVPVPILDKYNLGDWWSVYLFAGCAVGIVGEVVELLLTICLRLRFNDAKKFMEETGAGGGSTI
ncbi:hypothetical protein TWF718_003456 [Orbilia javanica]|uniref:Uncharacterized protein n=1 Tax=Orbilia javanica TaxID=47235 RepID=A0AAN8R921_9PEZI